MHAGPQALLAHHGPGLTNPAAWDLADREHSMGIVAPFLSAFSLLSASEEAGSHGTVSLGSTQSWGGRHICLLTTKKTGSPTLGIAKSGSFLFLELEQSTHGLEETPSG